MKPNVHIDLSKTYTAKTGMVKWCIDNLSPHGFSYQAGFIVIPNPSDQEKFEKVFPPEDSYIAILEAAVDKALSDREDAIDLLKTIVKMCSDLISRVSEDESSEEDSKSEDSETKRSTGFLSKKREQVAETIAKIIGDGELSEDEIKKKFPPNRHKQVHKTLGSQRANHEKYNTTLQYKNGKFSVRKATTLIDDGIKVI